MQYNNNPDSFDGYGDDDEDPWDDDARHYPRRHKSKSPSTWVRKTRGLVVKGWEPQPLAVPQVDESLTSLTPIERSAEVFRYTFVKAEYWVSPGGWMREWLRFNVRLALLLAMPALLVAPLISTALKQLTAWITYLSETTSKMVLFPLSALLVIGLVCALVSLAKALPIPLILRARSRMPRPPQSYYDD